jgi:hypothetical protein
MGLENQRLLGSPVGVLMLDAGPAQTARKRSAPVIRRLSSARYARRVRTARPQVVDQD